MKKTLTDYNLKNKKVTLRCDLNVPIKNGLIKDDTRILASLKTINYLIEHDCQIIILSHLGKIKTASDCQTNSLYPVSVRLQELLNTRVLFSKYSSGPNLSKLASTLKPREVLLVENTRFEDLDHQKESNCNLELAREWASLGEIFINDAYGTCHRAHASNVGICQFLPSALGFLVEEEITKLDEILEEDTHPFVVIMGGAKVSDKIKMIDNLITKCDKLLIGGAMAYTFLKAQGLNVGSSIVDDNSLDFCQNILTKYPDKIVLPEDSLTATSLDSKEPKVLTTQEFNSSDIGLDIGPKTIELFKTNLKSAKRVIINGPMGLFENELYRNGTKELYQYLAKNHIKTLIGGGDSASSVNLLGYQNSFYHISTGGGATLEYLEGNSLPALEAISPKITS